jgi:ferredoxin/flavodoxin---NADP+ reductase
LVPVNARKGLRIIPVRGSTEKPGHRFDPDELQTVRVAANVEIAPGTWRLSFPRSWDFVPGQSIGLTIDPAMPARFYSIASGTGDRLVDVLYDRVPDGLLTPRLADLRPGDALLCSRPFGAFRDSVGPSCWIATGTGIAPFVSMARSGHVDEKLLLHGSRSIAGLLDRDWFATVMGNRYIPCCTREKEEGVFPGRPTEWLRAQPLPPSERWLLCGNSGMVVDARDILINRGVSFTQVISEIYF